jgi:drug/metabolite transporter (DMT)-like permease
MSATRAPEPAPDGPRQAVLLGVGLMLFAGFMSSFLHVGIRYVSPEVPVTQIVLLRCVFTILATLPAILHVGRDAWRTNAPALQIVRGVVGVTSMTTWYYALAALPLAEAGALSFTQGIFMTLGAALVFKEDVEWRRWLAVAVGLAGALVVLRPGYVAISLGAIAAIGSSALWATSLLMAKGLARYDSSLTITFYQPMMIAPTALLLALPVWVWPSLEIWLILAGMGLAAALGNFGYVHSLRVADASVTTPADYVRLVWMVMWGLLLFGEVPDPLTLAGSAIIFGSTIWLTRHEARKAPAAAPSPASR